MRRIDKINCFDMLILKAICSEEQNTTRTEIKNKLEKYLTLYNIDKKKYTRVYLHQRLAFLESLELINKTKDVITTYNLNPKTKFVLIQYIISYFELAKYIK